MVIPANKAMLAITIPAIAPPDNCPPLFFEYEFLGITLIFNKSFYIPERNILLS